MTKTPTPTASTAPPGTPVPIDVRLGQAEARIDELAAQIEELRGQLLHAESNQGAHDAMAAAWPEIVEAFSKAGFPLPSQTPKGDDSKPDA